MGALTSLPPSQLWLIAGAVLAAMEAFGIPGIGLLFGGIAAFLVAIIIEAGVIMQEDFALQFGAWFIITIISALLLWKPMKHWRSRPSSPAYSNMIGSTATICEGDLVAGKKGKAIWSGARMNAEIAPDMGVEILHDGETAIIHAVDGNTLQLKPHRS